MHFQNSGQTPKRYGAKRTASGTSEGHDERRHRRLRALLQLRKPAPSHQADANDADLETVSRDGMAKFVDEDRNGVPHHERQSDHQGNRSRALRTNAGGVRVHGDHAQDQQGEPRDLYRDAEDAAQAEARLCAPEARLFAARGGLAVGRCHRRRLQPHPQIAYGTAADGSSVPTCLVMTSDAERAKRPSKKLVR